METITKEKIEIAPEILVQINTQEERQVIVHATAIGIPNLHTIRVWPTIYLIPKGTSHKCKLLHHFNIVSIPKAKLSDHQANIILRYCLKDCLPIVPLLIF